MLFAQRIGSCRILLNIDKTHQHSLLNGSTTHNSYQYDETYPQDEKRILTPLGRQQAQVTGKRLGQYIRGINEEFGPCNVKVVRVSNLARAKETAEIICDNLGVDVELAEPDELLNEGRCVLFYLGL